MDTICGLDCSQCTLKDTCGGCGKTNGHPFGGACVVASCCQSSGLHRCGQCPASCKLRKELIEEFHRLGIEELTEVTSLNALKGSYINLEYLLPNGKTVKLLEDDKIYLGNQICKKGGTRCYGLAADESHLLVCEYGNGGSDPEIVVYKKRKRV